ncbi:MAG: energy-coupling factor transporter transmembrane component T [Methanoregula sp.]
MQDPRIRLICAFLLSLAAFVSITGAILVFIWWLVFTPRWHSIRYRNAFCAALVMFVIISVVMSLTGSDGLLYLVRMAAILIIGSWVYSESCTSDFLSLGTWLLGKRTGFETGMIAGMAMQMADSLSDDFTRIRIATRMKEQPWSIRSIVPAGRIIIHDAIRRADETAEVLAIRGYRGGGTICPHFCTPFRDVIAGTCAAIILVLAYIHVSEFFILYR